MNKKNFLNIKKIARQEMKNILKIIIVDDHKVFRKSLAMTIKRLYPHSEIKEAGNGKEFLKILENYPDLIFMDIKMPEMNGIEATEKAIKLKPGLKILGISMFKDADQMLKMKESGAKGFIQKGGDQEEIRMVMEKILEGEEYFERGGRD